MFKLTVLVLTIALTAVVALGQAPTLRIETPDGPSLPADLFYGSVKVKPLRLRPGTNTVITIDDSDFFVNQQYVDFLNRFPDPGGYSFWFGQFTPCTGPSANQCIFNKRVEVSNEFSVVLEFGQSAAFVYRLYRGSFGNSQPFPNPDSSNQAEANKIPLYSKFKSDRQVVIGGASLPQQQLNLANEFVTRPEFLSKYPATLTLDQFVDAVLATLNTDLAVDLTSQRSALIALGSRGAVMYRLSDDNATNPINNAAFIDKEYNRAFVYSQYGGFLRRDSDVGGFLFWKGQVDSAPLRSPTKQRAMVCSFITAGEYQLRFGNSVTHNNSECNAAFP